MGVSKAHNAAGTRILSAEMVLPHLVPWKFEAGRAFSSASRDIVVLENLRVL